MAFAKNESCTQILDMTLHMSPSQDHDELHNFCSGLKRLFLFFSSNNSITWEKQKQEMT